MRMQEGGNPFLEQLSGQDRGIVLPEAVDRRERAQAQREAMRQDAAAKDFSFEMARGERSPARPMQPGPIPRDQINQAGIWFPLLGLTAGIGGGAFGLSYLLGGDEEEGPQPPLRPTYDRDAFEADRQAAEQAAASEESPAVGVYQRPGAGAGPVMPTGSDVAAEEEAGPTAMSLASMYSFTPEQRAERLRAAFEGREAVYDEILGDPERRRSVAKSQLLFSIAQRALQFASGVSPEGQPMSGSMLSQAARSFAPVAGDLATYASQMDAEDREIRAARLAAAEKDVSAEQTLRGRLFEAAMKAREEAEDEKQLRPVSEAVLQPDEDAVNLSINQAFNFGSGLKALANRVTSIANLQAYPEAAEAVRQIEAFNDLELVGPLGKALTGAGRTSNLVIELVRKRLPTPADIFSSVPEAISKYTSILDMVDDEIRQLADEYENYREFGMTKEGLNHLSSLNSLLRLRYRLDGVIRGLNEEVPEAVVEDLANVQGNAPPEETPPPDAQ